jgi:ubiquinone biosynthesis accessory factor UbiJ
MKTFALATMEQIVNKYLQLDPEIGRWLAPLDMKTIAIMLDGLNLTVYCHVGDERLYFMSDCYTAPDATLRGTPLALLAAKQDPHAAAAQGKITVDGDSETIQAFNQLFQQLHIDWEAVIAGVCGDTVATGLSRIARKVKQTSHAAATDMATHVGEYLQHELNVLPPQQEITDFCNDVDKLRHDAERLIAHFEQTQGNI